jgi:Flp pilus assembly pilin Flp
MPYAKQISRRLYAFLCEQDGVIAVEYAVLLAVIAVAAVSAIVIVGYHVTGTATSVSARLPAGSDVQVGESPSYSVSHVTTSVP